MKNLVVIVLCLLVPGDAAAQAPLTFLPFRGVAVDDNGRPRFGTVSVLFAIYAEPVGGVPLWAEIQAVSVDADGRYQVLLGTTTEGMPSALFDETRWLGVQPEGQAEQARVVLALEAAEEAAQPQGIATVELPGPEQAPPESIATVEPPEPEPVQPEGIGAVELPALEASEAEQLLDRTRVAESTFCLDRAERKCVAPIADGDQVSLSALPVDAAEVPRIWFYSALHVSQGTIFVHAWDGGDRASGRGGRVNPLDVKVVAHSASDRYRAFSYRNVPAPGLFRVVVVGEDGEPLPGSESRTVRVVR